MKARLIAYYLPQFHPTPENNEWWGNGFTEWTNVTKAKPLFKNHKQPKLPADLGFYDLRVPETREAQAQLAKECGIEGFCYWHYWFGNGKKLLDYPINEILKTQKPDFPFCFAWANQTWGGLPYGDGFNRILVEQTYPGIKDYEDHFYNLLPFFKDPRYIKVNDMPVFQVNTPLGIPNPNEFINIWQSLAVKNGLAGIFFIAHALPDFEYEKYGYNALNFVTPLHLFQRYKHSAFNDLINKITKRYPQRIKNRIFGRKPTLYEYSKIVECSNYSDLKNDRFIIPVAIPNWDHTPRSKNQGSVILNSTPELFLKNLDNCFELIKNRKKSERFIFIKSWNEWAEGNYLEPDVEFGKSYLEAISQFQNS